MGIAALVLGIIAVVLGVLGMGFPIGTITGVLGIILGAVAKKNDPANGMATGGLVCAVIGTVLSLLFYFACAACVGSAASLF